MLKKTIKLLPFALGLIVLLYGFMSFIIAIELYIGYRLDRDFNGCIFGGQRKFPWLELVSSIIFGLIGISLFRDIKKLLKFIVVFSFLFFFSTILINLIEFIWCNISLIGYDAQCITKFPILELGGVLFFVVILSEYRKHNWKKEIKEFGLKKHLIGFVLIFLLWFLLKKI